MHGHNLQTCRKITSASNTNALDNVFFNPRMWFVQLSASSKPGNGNCWGQWSVSVSNSKFFQSRPFWGILFCLPFHQGQNGMADFQACKIEWRIFPDPYPACRFICWRWRIMEWHLNGMGTLAKYSILLILPPPQTEWAKNYSSVPTAPIHWLSSRFQSVQRIFSRRKKNQL